MRMDVFLPVLLTVLIIIGFGVAAYFLGDKTKKKDKEEEENITMLDGPGSIVLMIKGTISGITENPPEGITVTVSLIPESKELLNLDSVQVPLSPYMYEGKDYKENDPVFVTFVEGKIKDDVIFDCCSFGMAKTEEAPAENEEESAE